MNNSRPSPEIAPEDVITVTPEEASRRTGIPEHTIRKAMAAHELDYFDFSRKVKVIPLNELNRWLNKHRVGSNEQALAPAAGRSRPARPLVGRMTLQKQITLARAKKAFSALHSGRDPGTR